MTFRKFGYILLPFFLLFGYLFAIKYSPYYVSISLVVLFVFTLIFWVQIGKSFKAWPLFLTPAFLTISTFLFLVFLDAGWLRTVLLIVTFLFVALYQVQVYNFLYDKQNYQKFALVNLSSYINVFSLFLAASSFIGLRLFLNLQVWVLALLMFVIFFVLILHFFWVNTISSKKRLLYSIILALLLVEVFWVLTFLSIHFLISGLILTILYYLVTLLSTDYLTDSLIFKTAARYVGIAMISIVLILITAQWF